MLLLLLLLFFDVIVVIIIIILIIVISITITNHVTMTDILSHELLFFNVFLGLIQ